MEKYRIKFSMAAIVFALSMILQQSVEAKEPQHPEKEVVFVLDASGSMNANDPNRLAIDGIAQLVYTLPSDYAVGLAAYNTNVILEKEPVENGGREELVEKAKAISYADYSNAGAGLSRAVDSLSDSGAGSKTIVLLSDGEILLKGEAATEEAGNAYREAVKRAEQNGIVIHVIGLGDEMEDTNHPIFAAADETGGGIYYTPQAVGIQGAIDDILINRLGIRQLTSAIVDTDGTMQTFSIDMPFANAGKVRVLLVGDTQIQNLYTNFQADSAKQINGERYSLIEMFYPKGDSVEIGFSGAPGSRVMITMVPEYQVEPKADITYEDRLPEEKGALFYEREASVMCSFYDLENQNIQLWTEAYFDHARLPAQMGAAVYEASVEQGQLLMKEQVSGDAAKEIVFDYSALPVNVIAAGQLSIELEGPPALPAEEPKPPYLAIGLGIGAALLLAAVIWIWRHPKPKQPPAEEPPEPGKYSYVGKLNIYITRAPSGYDMPPLSYDLFRLPSGKVISLCEVLESCDIKEYFAGAEQIYFKSDAGRSIILTNNSDCTILRSREILMKKKSYQIPAGTKIDVSFEDEISELTIQYKDLKPSEMW